MKSRCRRAVRNNKMTYRFVRNSDFVHLHLHSEYSLLDGACRISEIPKAAKKAGHKYVAITDHGVMYGAVDFFRACTSEGIKPIIGCEVYVSPRKMTDKVHELDSKSCHLVLLVKNEVGYKNLTYLVSKAFIDGFYSKPRIDLELLQAHSDGLCALSACLAGFIPKKLVSGEYEDAKAYALKLYDIFGKDSFYLELQDHGIEDQKLVNEGIIRLHRETGIPMVATNDVHYINKDDALVQSVLMCIQTNTRLEEGRPIGFETDEFYYKSTSEMYRLFSAFPDAVKNSERIAKMCSFEFSFGKLHLPRYVPENGLEPREFLSHLTRQGFSERVSKGHIVFSDIHCEELYKKRISHELSVIDSMGYSEYFLIVWDFVNYARTHGISVGPGRGSGAGSLVAYLLGIVDIDPVKYDLIFERFLNPERVSMPDFDIDFSYDRRDEAVRYVREKYGDDHVAQIITFGTMAARAAVRDVGRALGMSYSDVDTVASLIPHALDVTIKKALETEELRALYNTDSNVKRLLDIAIRLEGMPRHSSTHAAGVVITEAPLYEYLPLSVNNDMPVTQFTMENVAQLGLLKFDFLALRYLTIIDSCVHQILENDESFDLSSVSMNDPEAYSMISNGDTDGVFQLESGGMRQLLIQMKPSCIDDIIAAIALYRPGPMDSIPKYLKNREKRESVKYPISELEPILGSTYGCIVYQEQVMQIFRSVAGYSLGKADVVRRAISKKKTDVLVAERASFIEGAKNKGISEKIAVELFDDIVSFANYAFNKSHAAAYAVLSFRTAYLKCHYPREYLSALLTSVMDSPSKMSEYITVAKSKGIRVLSPCVNESYFDFHVSGTDIRFGLMGIKNLGKNTVLSIIEERNINGRFITIEDFISRIDATLLNKRQLESLIRAGALDCFGKNRRQLLMAIDSISEKRNAPRIGGVEGQFDLFEDLDEASNVQEIIFENVPEFPSRELLLMEKECIGVYLSGHVLSDYSKCISLISPSRIVDLIEDSSIGKSSGFGDGDRVELCAVITSRTNKQTKNGDKMAFVTVEDESGECEVIVFPKLLDAFAHLLFVDSPIYIRGRVSKRDDEESKVILEKAAVLSDNDSEVNISLYKDSLGNNRAYDSKKGTVKSSFAVSDGPKRLFIKMDMSNEKLKKRVFSFLEIFDGHDYALFYDSSRNKYVTDLTFPCNVNDFLIKELRAILGEDSIVLK